MARGHKRCNGKSGIGNESIRPPAHRFQRETLHHARELNVRKHRGTEDRDGAANEEMEA
jgi:hypothetical protein